MPKKSTNVRIILAATRLLGAVAPALAARWLEHVFLTPSRWPMPGRERDWSATARRDTLDFDAARKLPLLSWGSGPVVLLVHGWSGRGSQLGAFAGPLVERGFRVVTFDAPAHGTADGSSTGLPEFADAVARVADHLGPLHAVVAHSLGAAATTIAVSRGLSAQRLVYLASPENPADYLDMVARYLGLRDAVARRAQWRIERRFGVPFEAMRGTRLSPGLNLPLLMIHDRGDTEVPFADGERIAGAWPGARLVPTEGLGHRRILRDPHVIRAAVDFAAGTEGAQARPAAGPDRIAV